jgi:hypothetical protein
MERGAAGVPGGNKKIPKASGWLPTSRTLFFPGNSMHGAEEMDDFYAIPVHHA